MGTNIQSIGSINNAGTTQENISVQSSVPVKTEQMPSDKFEPQTKKSGITFIDGVLGVTTAGLGITTVVFAKKSNNLSKLVTAMSNKLGNCLKRLGKQIPETIEERMSLVTSSTLRDKLTGLYNRACMDSYVEKAYNEAKNSGKNLAVGFIDMDHFKCFNDEFNHDTGDKVLQSMSQHIKSVSDKHKVKCFRYGGEEFVVIAPGEDTQSIKKILEEINDGIKNDEYIQGLKPEFMKKSNSDVDFLTDVTKKLDTKIPDSIFARLKEKSRTEEQNVNLKNDILNLVNSYVERYNLHDNKNYSAIVEKLNNTPKDKLGEVLNVDTEIKDNSTLGNVLDEIFGPAKTKLDDTMKGKRHIDKNGCFTCSGGGVDLVSNPAIKNGAELVKLSDAKEQTAKNNRNTILI